MSIFGKVFGDSKDGPNKVARDAMAGQADAAGYAFNMTRPVLTQLSTRYNNFLSNGMDVTSTPQYAALKDQTEQQYGAAKNNILENIQPGGALSSALANLERNKASSLVQGAGDISNQELSRAFAFGTGQTPVALGGLGSAAQNASYLSASQNQQNAAATQGIGYALGNYLGRNNGSTGAKAGGAGSMNGTGSVQGDSNYFWDL